jgi:hypothetical protein
MTSGWANAVPAKAASNQKIAAVNRTNELPYRFMKKILTPCAGNRGMRNRFGDMANAEPVRQGGAQSGCQAIYRAGQLGAGSAANHAADPAGHLSKERDSVRLLAGLLLRQRADDR